MLVNYMDSEIYKRMECHVPFNVSRGAAAPNPPPCPCITCVILKPPWLQRGQIREGALRSVAGDHRVRATQEYTRQRESVSSRTILRIFCLGHSSETILMIFRLQHHKKCIHALNCLPPLVRRGQIKEGAFRSVNGKYRDRVVDVGVYASQTECLQRNDYNDVACATA